MSDAVIYVLIFTSGETMKKNISTVRVYLGSLLSRPAVPLRTVKTEAKEIRPRHAENSQMQTLIGWKNKAIIQVVAGVALPTLDV